MKLFQQLLVAPAALGLLAPVAVQAAELNIDGVNKYAAEEQVTSINQFSDVKPTDWAFQALSNLIERYGCVAGYPNGTYKGGQAMTRYEAAALLNACLDRITEVTDELKRLMAEFEKELAVLRGRVDGLEAKVGELEATQFSTTTKLTGKATFIMGANSYGGNARISPAASAFFGTSAATIAPNGVITPGVPILPVGSSWSNRANQAQGATAFNYDIQLNFDTSFTGKDLLRTRLRAGNFADGPWAGGPVVGLNATEIAFEENCGTGADCGDVVAINRLFYQFPLGSNFTATVGGRVRQDDMLAVWPSAYPADTVLDIFTYAGAPGAYSLNLGAGGGLWWKSGGFSVSANYVSANGDSGNPIAGTANCGGIGNACSAQTGTAQVAYTGSNWGLAAAYTYSSGGAGTYAGNATPLANTLFLNANATNSVGISGYWQPSNSGWVPSISTGWGINTNNFNGTNFADGGIVSTTGITKATSQSWYVGLQWDDVFIKGNAAGMAVGQPTFLTAVSGGNAVFGGPATATAIVDGNYAWEWWYKFQVTDNISVTPALYYLSAPLGQVSKNVGIGGVPTGAGGSDFNNFGAFVKTTFKF
ncbi:MULTISPECIES: iron uptake porin [unclassified Cyanobium]|uniref:iron uptake porin n=1 Tax=unclassified Cyanobium TaxID=2627006 RepID=UPI0020CE1EC0|nr:MULTISPECIES: iron uptake porin [unclassified Cyanobium]MCP9858656.1 carbohydrate porin [Cyanobium sp. Cruz-8H5]MCP9865961.1 carbohydrate porin [Cyanobium sp. Cruz-8D1]